MTILAKDVKRKSNAFGLLYSHFRYKTMKRQDNLYLY